MFKTRTNTFSKVRQKHFQKKGKYSLNIKSYGQLCSLVTSETSLFSGDALKNHIR